MYDGFMDTNDMRPLLGRTIVVTRTLAQAHHLADQLDRLGATVYEFATIEIRLIVCALPADLDEVDWVVFTSVNAVRGMKASMTDAGKAFAFPGARICAVGPATAEQLEASGVTCDLVPEEFTADAAFAALEEADSLAGKKVLLPQGNIARQGLAESLLEAGAQVERMIVYETVCPHHDERQIRGLIDARPDLVTFTSASTAQNFALTIHPGQLPSTKYASIGPQTTAAAVECGLPVAIEAERHDIAGLIDAIVSHYS